MAITTKIGPWQRFLITICTILDMGCTRKREKHFEGKFFFIHSSEDIVIFKLKLCLFSECIRLCSSPVNETDTERQIQKDAKVK